MCKIEDWQRKKILMSNDNAPFRKDVNKTGGKPISCQTSVYTLIRFISFKILKELKGDATREPVRRINLKLQKGSLMELCTVAFQRLLGRQSVKVTDIFRTHHV